MQGFLKSTTSDADDDGAPVIKMKGATFQRCPPRTHGRCTHTLGTRMKKITIYKSLYWTLRPNFAISMAFGFDCAPGERTSSPFFAHSFHRTSTFHILHSCPSPPSHTGHVGVLQPPILRSHSTSPSLQGALPLAHFPNPYLTTPISLAHKSAGLPARAKYLHE